MLKKRLIGMVTVKNGWAVQSFGYNRYLPLGKPECLVENLDRWGADEILVMSIDRSSSSLGPDLQLLKRLARLGLETPLIYGGGIHSVADGVEVIQLGADRICVDALMHDDIEIIRGLSERLGVQAVIGALPLSLNKGRLKWLDYRSKKNSPLLEKDLVAISNVISELILIDWVHEGLPGGFEQRLVTDIPISNIPLIVFGGVSEHSQMIEFFSMSSVAAIAIGNFLNYKENAIQGIKELLVGMPLRLPVYETKNSLLNNG